MKIRPVGAELFREDGRLDRHMTKLVVAFRNFANAPKNESSSSSSSSSSCCCCYCCCCCGSGGFGRDGGGGGGSSSSSTVYCDLILGALISTKQC